MSKIGPKIKKLRELREISMRELARRAKVSAPYLLRLERGDHSPGSDTLARLVAALGYEMSEFYRLTEAA